MITLTDQHGYAHNVLTSGDMVDVIGTGATITNASISATSYGSILPSGIQMAHMPSKCETHDTNEGFVLMHKGKTHYVCTGCLLDHLKLFSVHVC